MNALRGTLASVDSNGSLSRVIVDAAGMKLTVFLIGTPASDPLLTTGAPVELLFKETEVAVAKGFTGEISSPNLFRGRIGLVSQGPLFTHLRIDAAGVSIGALIDSAAASRMGVREGEEVTAIVNPNDITLGAARP